MLADDPVTQFERWWDAWLATDPYEPAACVLATADEDGRPSARFVLCRAIDQRGFVFYTNFESRKGRELGVNPRAALVFGWLELARQVRIEGPVVPVDAAEADTYWALRPRGSQLGAWASDQSEVVSGRRELDRHEVDAETQYGSATDGPPIPRPPYWGGYRVEPERVEFWQGQPNRLHDRFAYHRDDGGGWGIDRLAP